MKITITIETGNEAMQTWEDVKEAIERRLRFFEGEVSTSETRPMSDLNGNTIGSMEVESDDDLPPYRFYPETEEDDTMTDDEQAEEAGRRG